MDHSIPPELIAPTNAPVLSHLQNLSAHSDVTDAFQAALTPLGDIHYYCPNPHNYRYLLAYTRQTIFAFCCGMNTVAFRLTEAMKTRALAAGATSYPQCGTNWVGFTLFRSDWPKPDLEFWARQAYLLARQLS